MTAEKPTREEALAWSRSVATEIPDELVIGHPLPPPDLVAEALLLAREALSTPSKCLVPGCKCEKAQEHQQLVEEALEAIRKAEVSRAVRIPRTPAEIKAFMEEVGPLPSVLATSEWPPLPCPECESEKKGGPLQDLHTCAGDK